jgi:adenylylsulfate kinase
MPSPKYIDGRKRSLVKSVTFRVIVVAADLVVVYAFTHQIETTVAVTIVTNISSTLLYYGHERVWNRIRWGRR